MCNSNVIHSKHTIWNIRYLKRWFLINFRLPTYTFEVANLRRCRLYMHKISLLHFYFVSKRLLHLILVRYAKEEKETYYVKANKKILSRYLVQLTLVACILTKPKFKINEIFECRKHDEKYSKIEFLLCIYFVVQPNIIRITFYMYTESFHLRRTSTLVHLTRRAKVWVLFCWCIYNSRHIICNAIFHEKSSSWLWNNKKG